MTHATVSAARKWARIIAWICIVLIALFTVSPVSWRPDFGHVNIERFVAFGLAGILFGFAYPKRVLALAIAVIGAAAFLELMQFLIPGRDPSLANFILKSAGGLLGLGAAAILNRVVDRPPVVPPSQRRPRA